MSERELKQIASRISRSDKYVNEIADKVYERLFKDFSRVEDYMKASNERYHAEHAKKYKALERKVNKGVWVIGAALLIIVVFQSFFK